MHNHGVEFTQPAAQSRHAIYFTALRVRGMVVFLLNSITALRVSRVVVVRSSFWHVVVVCLVVSRGDNRDDCNQGPQYHQGQRDGRS